MTGRRRALGVAALVTALWTQAEGQFTPYASRSAFLPTSPGVAPAGLLGFVNPAVLGRVEAPESFLAWSTESGRGGPVNDWGLFSALPRVGFGLLRRSDGRIEFNDYRLGLGAGDRRASFGLTYGWSSEAGPDPLWAAGALLQPSSAVSVGLTWTATFDGDDREIAGDLGVRPFGTPRLTLFAEGALASAEVGDDDFWSAGADLRLSDGLHLAARYLDDRTVSLGLRLELDGLGLWTQARRDRHRAPDGRDRTRSLHAVRLGPHRGSALAVIRHRRPAFVGLDLHGAVRHRTYPLFDDSRSLLGLLADLRRVEDDPGLAGVALNLSGLRLDASQSWELRQRLQSLRDAGKGVVVYLDRAELRRYHLASVADRIVLDPAGGLALRGFAAGQLYVQEALEKLGIGSQVRHYHEYKTALEPLYRTDMSETDREQWQALVDDAYERTRDDICAARGLEPDAFDRLVDDVTVLLPDDALAHGLVDTIGRWDTVESLVAAEAPGGLVGSQRLVSPVDELWGAPPTVALVYAVGICAMDSGIRARTLSAELRELAEDESVDAVVLRVDSPGGGALASDLVADAMKACRVHKPVVVSQARMAASGGYWISMESDAIVATPETVTGSIGLWTFWLYNRGFRERLGLSVDHVQVGEHADLGLGMPLPLLGLNLPERPLTHEELARVDHVLGSLYDDFVGRVADARGRTPEQIDQVARGRVWSARAAVEAGLVDTLGGLETALAIARERAGVDTARPLRVLEVPRLAPFAVRGLPGALFGARSALPPEPMWLEWLRFRLDHNGEPLLMLPEPYLDELGSTRPGSVR